MKKILGFLLMTFFVIGSHAQDDEPGGFRTGLAIEKNISKKFSIVADAELRTLGFTSETERYLFGVGADYEIFKNFKLGLGYEYQKVQDSYNWGYSIYGVDSARVWMQPRHRFQGDISYKYKIGDFTLSLRERAQATFKNDNDRIKQNGDTNFARVNPDFTWRNRIKVEYNIPKCKFTPALSVESYMLFSDPDITSAYFTKLKYTLGVEYKINKKNSIELYGMYSNERSGTEIVVPGPNYYIIGPWANSSTFGISYAIKL